VDTSSHVNRVEASASGQNSPSTGGLQKLPTMENRRYIFDGAPHYQKAGVSSFNECRSWRTRPNSANADENIGSEHFF
jgi:hypothetical protein